MKAIVRLKRDEKSNYQCMGKVTVEVLGEVVFESESIERGDNDNRARESCFPEGIYPIVLEYSHRFKKDLWEIYNVVGRSECKFHAANFSRQLNGCVALGDKRIDIDGDGEKDVTNSRETMSKFHKSLEGFKFALLIVE